MDRKLSAQLLIILSICYGITIAILGALESSATGFVALAGALLVGGLWAVRGLLSRRI